MDLLLKIINVLTELFVFTLVLGVMALFALHVVDRTQTRRSLRRYLRILAAQHLSAMHSYGNADHWASCAALRRRKVVFQIGTAN